MLNNGSDMLDEILQVGKGSRNLTGIGFDYQSLNRQGKTTMTKFIPAGMKHGPIMSNQMSYILQDIKKLILKPSSCLGNVIIMVNMVT